VPPPFRAEGEHVGIDLPGARALFTTRRGGVSQGAFESLNLGLRTQDEPGRVAANRERLAALIGVCRERLAHGRQVHGAMVRRVSEPPAPAAEPAEADGQATSAPGVAPLVLVADCLPVALAGEGAVAMLHAGWRGLAAGVVEEGVAAVRALGAVGRLEAAIGPGAGGCCYRVGAEVLTRFAEHPEAVRPDGHGGRLDLKAVAASRLLAAGVDAVHDSGVCTICSDPALFFSHRRDGERTGRQAGVVRRR
jgi:YfiH family protein